MAKKPKTTKTKKPAWKLVVAHGLAPRWIRT